MNLRLFSGVGRCLWLVSLSAACAEGLSAEPPNPYSNTGAAGESGSAAAGGGAGAAGSNAGTAGAAGASGAAGTAAGSGGSTSAPQLDRFSFFVTSYRAMQLLSGSPDGFGGDLRFGKADGLAGADEICRQIAESSQSGSSVKTWRAFLSVTKNAQGTPVHAIDRIGEGPWYDRLGRLVAANKADLVQTRPRGADAAIINDLPNEDGVPNQKPDGKTALDNHDILTGTGANGMLFSSDWASTCHDWTSKVGADGKPRVGHSWPRMGGSSGGMQAGAGGSADSWMSALNEAGCAPGASLVEMGPPDPDRPTVGSGGGYGGIYCFALVP